MAQQGWSSLPADLVNRVADCLLATNDLDCYTDLRAVCQHWRSVTAHPRSIQHDPRFRPSRWVMLDEPEVVSSSTLLFVNTATGRFLRRRLLLLHDHDRDREYIFVTSTTGGLVVVAAREPPNAVSVLNLFTGSLIRFAAPLPMPSELVPRLQLAAEVVGSSPTLVLASVGFSCVYWAEPKSECFSATRHHQLFPASRLPLIAAAVNRRDCLSGAKDLFDHQLWSEDDKQGCRCYVVVAAGSGGDMLAVLKRHRGVDVFKIDAAGNVMERINSIGSQAIFLGVRCLVVDTDCFPTVEPNCAYFERITHRGKDECYIYKFHIGIYDDEQEPELVSADLYTHGDLALPH